jgi:hypothetical protein
MIFFFSMKRKISCSSWSLDIFKYLNNVGVHNLEGFATLQTVIYPLFVISVTIFNFTFSVWSWWCFTFLCMHSCLKQNLQGTIKKCIYRYIYYKKRVTDKGKNGKYLKYVVYPYHRRPFSWGKCKQDRFNY